MEFEPVIGLEVHAQLLTESKIFCGCSTQFGAPPNTLTCPICLGMPGTLPVLNKKAVEYAIRMGLATHCTIAEFSTFARKNYFYPDLPKGYQISQYDQPLGQNGFIEIELIHDGKPVEGIPPKRIRLLRIHLEEDAGKSIHDPVVTGGESTFVDLNRCGVPLIEIVSMPDMVSSAEAYAYLTKLRQILLYLGINDGNMEEGSLRCDCNVSIRPKGTQELGTRSELKNMNSFRNVERAIEFEIKRQQEILLGGGRVIQETFLWDADANESRPMRSKEEAHDYRYFPEPDLVPLRIEKRWVEEIRSSLPELPMEKGKRFMEQHFLPKYDSYILTLEKAVADYYERTVEICRDPKLVSNWVMSEVLRNLKESDITIEKFQISPERLGGMLNLVLDGTINQKIAKIVFEEMLISSDAPSQVIEKKGLVQVTDMSLIEKAIDQAITGNPDQFTAFKAGKTKLFGFFVGEVMKLTGGKANPKIVNELLKMKLEVE